MNQLKIRTIPNPIIAKRYFDLGEMSFLMIKYLPHPITGVMVLLKANELCTRSAV